MRPPCPPPPSTPATPIDYRSELQPVAAWKTSGAKIFSGIAIAGGTVATALGVVGLLSGRGLGINTLMKSAEVSDEIAAKGKTITRILSGILAAGAGLGTLIEKSFAYDPAAGAARARNFVQLHEQLNARDTSQGRG